MDAEIAESAVLGKLDMTEEEVCAYSRFPIAYVPNEYLSKELMIRAIERYPLSLKDIPTNRISKALSVAAVKGNAYALRYVPRRLVTDEMVAMAIVQDAWTVRYVPEEKLSQELCDKCFNKDMSRH